MNTNADVPVKQHGSRSIYRDLHSLRVASPPENTRRLKPTGSYHVQIPISFVLQQVKRMIDGTIELLGIINYLSTWSKPVFWAFRGAFADLRGRSTVPTYMYLRTCTSPPPAMMRLGYEGSYCNDKRRPCFTRRWHYKCQSLTPSGASHSFGKRLLFVRRDVSPSALPPSLAVSVAGCVVAHGPDLDEQTPPLGKKVPYVCEEISFLMKG